MELWDAYYPDGRKAGVALRRGELPPEYRHVVVEILVQHTDGTLLLMQRAPRKPIYPSLWEASAGGAVLSGEAVFDGALRELREETGIAAEALEKLGEAVTENTIYHTYLCVTDWDKNAITLQEGETVAYKWVSAAELRGIIAAGKCNSNNRGQLTAVLERLEAGQFFLPLAMLQPSQFYLSAEKLRAVQGWLHGLRDLSPVPVKALEGGFVLTDGHTRAAAAAMLGLSLVPVCPESEELDWNAYRACVVACRERGVRTPADLVGRVLSKEDYQKRWLDWCRALHEKVF